MLEILTKKICRECGEEKSQNDFYKNKSYASGYDSKCKRCCCAYIKKRAKHKEDGTIEYHLKRKYGIDLEQYNSMLASQGNRCLICSTHQDDLTRRLAVDHCHKTGVVRGLLCAPCNTAIGSLKDRTDLLQNAITYLESSGDSWTPAENSIEPTR